MRYGQATSAIVRTGGGYGEGARVSQALTRAGFSPPPQAAAAPPAARTRTGVEGGNTQSAIMMGFDQPTNIVPITVVGPPLAPGILLVTMTPCEAVVLLDLELTDPSGKLLLTDVFTCRDHIFEGGFASVAALQSASTSRPVWVKSLQRLILTQNIPLSLRFQNPLTVGNGLDIQGTAQVLPIRMNANLPPETEAALARWNSCQ